MEERRMEHEHRILERQHDLERTRQSEADRKKIDDKIVNMEDLDQPDG